MVSVPISGPPSLDGQAPLVTGAAGGIGGEPAPLGRYGQPKDIAQSILFLASPASSWITGKAIDINGGQYLN